MKGAPELCAARTGLLTVCSHLSQHEAVERVLSVIQSRALNLFAHVDHFASAKTVGLTMQQADLLLFGAPVVGTPAMKEAPTLGLDLPLRLLVWAGQDGKARLTYNEPAWLAGRHGLDPQGETARPLALGMRSLISAVDDNGANAPPLALR